MRTKKYFFSVLITILLLFILITSCKSLTDPSSRVIEDFNPGWSFILSSEDLSNEAKSDSGWRSVDLPHDWSIEGSFDKAHPATVGGGALPGGVGWYRKYFSVPIGDTAVNTFIHFDGIYWNSQVFVNGSLVGSRPNGYISFRYNISDFLNYGSDNNVIAVKVDNSDQPNSRWYSGSGIYRNVKLIKSSPVHFDTWGIYITTPEISAESARVTVSSRIINSAGIDESLILKLIAVSPNGKSKVTSTEKIHINSENEKTVIMDLKIQNPQLWSVDDPSLYLLEVLLIRGKEVIDNENISFGIRDFNFDPEEGFSLNGEFLKIKGVCNHHDLGCLGAAVNKRAIERQLEILKGMGCNAIRTSHNPPAPELLDLCDKMGFLVMDETFDMWKRAKTRFDYSQYWDEWYERDLSDHILRDRNHPSVIMWSIGNEIIEQWDSTGTNLTRELVEIVNSIDSTRPIVTGNNWPDPQNALLKADVMDLIGYNYKQNEFTDFHKKFPGKSFIATETNSGLMTRGHYDMPSDSIRRWPLRWDKPFLEGNEDHTVSAYDNVSAPWGSTHEETWKVMKQHKYLSGMFIWTGFDYLGEPTPYGWPSRSSYFGVIDLAGFPKDVYYMYKSEWTEDPVLHLLPHWNWQDGQDIDVMAYTNCESVELFLNGKTMGVRKNSDTVFHLLWKLKYEPGILEAVGILPGGAILRETVSTAGQPAKIQMEADRTLLAADGYDLSFITIDVLDDMGTLVPDADNKITFDIEGPAEIIGVDNGSQVSLESFKSNYRKAFNGKCLVVIKAGNMGGEVKVTAHGEGLQSAEIILKIG